MDETTQKLLEIGGNWVSGIGSLLAVWAALRIAKKQTEVKLAVVAGERQLITPGDTSPPPNYLFIQVTSLGQQPATITNLGWQTGLLRKRHAVQNVGATPFSNSVPIELTIGRQAHFMVSLDETQWLNSMAEMLDDRFPRLHAWSIMACVYTSAGTTTKKRLEPGIRKRLLDEHKIILAQKRSKP